MANKTINKKKNGEVKEVNNKTSNESNSNKERQKGGAPTVVDVKKKLLRKTGVETDVKGNKHQLTIRLDLSGLTEEEILVAAAEHLHIRWVRKQLLNVTEDLESLQDTVIDVSKYRPQGRKSDPVKSLKTQVDKLKAQGYSKEEILEMLE